MHYARAQTLSHAQNFLFASRLIFVAVLVMNIKWVRSREMPFHADISIHAHYEKSAHAKSRAQTHLDINMMGIHTNTHAVWSQKNMVYALVYGGRGRISFNYITSRWFLEWNLCFWNVCALAHSKWSKPNRRESVNDVLRSVVQMCCTSMCWNRLIDFGYFIHLSFCQLRQLSTVHTFHSITHSV